MVENSNRQANTLVQRISIASSILSGLSVSCITYILFLQTAVVSLSRVAFALVLFLVFAAANYFFMKYYLKESLTNILTHKLYFMLLSFLLPLLFLPLFYIVPAYPINPIFRQWTEIAVQYEVNANSHPLHFLKPDVRLQMGRDVLDAQSFRVVGTWKSAKDTFGLDPGMTAALQWVGTASPTMLLTLQAPTGSGTLTVYWDQSRSVFELSTDTPKQIIMVRKFSTPWQVNALLYSAAYLFSVWLLFILMIIFNEKFSFLRQVKHTVSLRLLLVLLAVILAILTVKLQLENLPGGADHYIHGIQLARHNAVLRGQAPNPWQYRVLSEYLVEGLIQLFQFLKIPDAIGFGFIFLRVLQNIAIFLLALALYQKISASKWIALTGILLLASSMKNAFYDNDLSLNTYSDLCFYLLTILLILNRRYYWLILITAFAALNRETSGLIPFLALAALITEQLPIHKKLFPFLLYGAIFAAIFFALHMLYPNNPLYIPYEIVPGPPMLIYNVTRSFTWAQLFHTLGLTPVIGLVFFFSWPRLWQYFFLALCPIWFLIHFVLSIAGETRLFLVPQAVIFIPAALFALKYTLDFKTIKRQPSLAT